LAGERPDFAGASEAAVKLAELLDSRDVLMVIDDVWKRSHLEPFVQGGDRCACLITTRITDVLPKATRKLNVDAMKKSEAMALLEAGLPKGDQRALADLVGKLGEWPLLIKLVNRVLFDRVEQGQQIDAALTFAAEKLNRQGLTAFDAGDADQRNDAVSKTIGVSLELLNSTTELPRLLELGIFPEDEDIPLDTVASLWQRTGEVDSFKSEELCERFFKLSLVLELDLGPRTVRLHDALRSFFISRLKDSRLVHDQLVETWPDPHKLPNKYAWKWYGWHVLKSSHPERLLNLLSDFNWLYAKLDATDVDSLLSEFTYATNQSDCLRLIGSAIALSAHVLAKDKTQVASQLVGRLPKALGNEIDRLQEAAARYNETAWIEPLKGSLQAPGGALIATREGPFISAKAIALTPNGNLVASHLNDDTLNVWDLSSGRHRCTLDVGVNLFMQPCVALSSDGRFAVSAAFANELKIWELQSGNCLRILKGHSGTVTAIAISRNGRMAVSASSDRALKLWYIQSGNCLRTLDVHSTSVSAVTLSADGRFSVTGSQEGYINVWDLQSGGCLRMLKGHSDAVSAIAISPDDRMAVSGSHDKTLIIWDLQSGDCLRIFQRSFWPSQRYRHLFRWPHGDLGVC
jgi:WD domain, G-beta repeat/NB-ARC domain